MSNDNEKKVAIKANSIPVVNKEGDKLSISRSSLFDSKVNSTIIAPLSTMDIEDRKEKIAQKTHQIALLKELLQTLENEKKDWEKELKK